MKAPLGCFLLCLLAGLPSLRAQESANETQEAQNLINEWQDMDRAISKARRDLSALQISYNGAEDEKARGDTAKRYDEVRDLAFGKATVFMKKIDSFLTRYPNNLQVRQKRLEDTTFDLLPAAKKADDAEVIYKVGGNAEMLHTAADWREKAYDYARAAELWEKAAEMAATFKVEDALGRCYMNLERFEKAQAAYERSRELATTDQQRRGAEANAKVAAQYVAAWPLEQKLRSDAEAQKSLPQAEILTDRGRIVVELFEDQAPNTVANFIELADRHFFDGQMFHRCIAYFMIQGGDPMGTGAGGPGYHIADEYALPEARLHFAGTLSMANVGQPNTGGSQFFITNTNTNSLNGRHTVFGRVLEGLSVAQVAPLDPTNKAEPFRIISVKVSNKRRESYVAEKLP